MSKVGGDTTTSSIVPDPPGAEADTHVLIAPLYPASIHFIVKSLSEMRVIVRGDVEGFRNRCEVREESYKQRFVRKDGPFRIIHVVGSAKCKLTENGVSKTRKDRIREVVRFDNLGIFDGTPGDPVSLVPLFPGRPIRLGGGWSPLADVRTPMGDGQVRYHFHTASERFGDEAQFLRITFEFEGALEPAGALVGATGEVTGEGWLIWNLAVSQRAEAHVRARYRLETPTGTAEQSVALDDWLEPRIRKGSF